MNVPLYVRRAARIIDRWWFAPRRQRLLAEAMGCQDAVTKFTVARRQHKAIKPHETAMKAACRAQLERELSSNG